MWKRNLPKKGWKIFCTILRQKNGVRKEKHFSTLPEARNWLADQQYNDRHDLVVANPNMTVDVWFEFWLNHLILTLHRIPGRNYQERYTHNIQPVLGNMLIADVKPMHCKAVLNRMDTEYAGSTIRQTYITMGTMFRSAIMNDIIAASDGWCSVYETGSRSR